MESVMQYDSNEPTYCTCKRISFGSMIACDNTEYGFIVQFSISLTFILITYYSGIPFFLLTLIPSSLKCRYSCCPSYVNPSHFMCSTTLKRCVVEWFHYECVGLKEEPASWLCPTCREESSASAATQVAASLGSTEAKIKSDLSDDS